MLTDRRGPDPPPPPVRAAKVSSRCRRAGDEGVLCEGGAYDVVSAETGRRSVLSS